MPLTNKLYLLTTFFTLLCLALFGYDVATYGNHPVGNNLVLVYLTLLSAYAADKEVGRWTKAKGAELAQRKGSSFVVIWAVFYALCYLAEHFQSGFKTPEGLAKVVISVVGVFFGTGISRRYYGMLKGEGEAWGNEDIRKAAEGARIKSEDALRREAILGLLKVSPAGLTAPELSKGSSISLRSVQRELAQLVAEKKVESFGKSRSSAYRLKAGSA